MVRIDAFSRKRHYFLSIKYFEYSKLNKHLLIMELGEKLGPSSRAFDNHLARQVWYKVANYPRRLKG